MTTLVGTQTEFSDALYQLCELDYDAIEAYESAVERLKSADYQSQLNRFKLDHQRHVQEIQKLLSQHQKDYPKGPSNKRLLTQGKVVLADLLGDKAILQAMLSNEKDTNIAYTTMAHHANVWPDAVELIERGLEDEKPHKAWFEKAIEVE